MNDKLNFLITDFMNNVGNYLLMEYDSIYHQEFIKDKNLSNMFDFVGSYYMGGSSVPDTARYVVELILMNQNGRKSKRNK